MRRRPKRPFEVLAKADDQRLASSTHVLLCVNVRAFVGRPWTPQARTENLCRRRSHWRGQRLVGRRVSCRQHPPSHTSARDTRFIRFASCEVTQLPCTRVGRGAIPPSSQAKSSKENFDVRRGTFTRPIASAPSARHLTVKPTSRPSRLPAPSGSSRPLRHSSERPTSTAWRFPRLPDAPRCDASRKGQRWSTWGRRRPA